MKKSGNNFEYTIIISWDDTNNCMKGYCPQLNFKIQRDDIDSIELFKDIADFIYETNLVSLGIS